ncbi:MAG TPA: FAD-dependent oxidoreductase [Thermoanaerobaculia bacterium]
MDALTDRAFDLLIVGGGIQGATLALEAARRGLSVLLLERGEFGGETTANSLRILHGGLRYLQSLDLPRFRESVDERRWFLSSFPDLVAPLPCLMPIYAPPRGGRLRRPAVLRLALKTSDLLSREDALPKGRWLSQSEVMDLFPGADRRGLRGGALWHDAVAPDPARLISSVLRWARSLGADVLDQVEATDLLTAGGRVTGVRAVDRRSGRSLEIRALAVVNCAGPWSREIARRFDRDIPRLFRPMLAFNLLLDREPLSRAALAVAAPGAVSQTWFFLPAGDRLLAGTAYASARGEEGPSEEEIAGFLAALNAAVPGLNARRDEVARVLWGRLPAAGEGSTVPARRPVIHHHGRHGGPEGLVSISGVKLTTARALSEKALAAS